MTDTIHRAAALITRCFANGGKLLLCGNGGSAADCARALHMHTLALTGASGSKMNGLCDLTLRADETETYKIQEQHIRMYHHLCILVEQAFFAE